MKVWLFRGAVWALFFAGYMVSAWATGKPASTDRPSAHPLPPPSYTRNAPPEGFTLPPVPESAEHGGDLRTLFVKHIVLDGNTIFPEKDLQSMVQPYEGRNVSIAELEDLRQKLTRYYIDQGYVNSGVVIPPDAFQDGELRFKIIAGQIDEIRLKGMGRLREGYVKNRLWNDPSKPFNLPILQDRFQLLLSDPLISQMKGSILPGDTSGHSILDVEVSRAKPYQLSLFADNQRPPSVGAEGYGLTGWVRNLTTLGDTVDFTVTSSEGADHYSGGFVLPITDSGAQLFFRFDKGDSSVVEEPLQKIDIKSTVHNMEGGISYPFIETVRKHFAVGLTVAVRKNKTTLLGRPFSFITGEETGKNQASVIRLFQDYSQRWEKHALTLRSTFNFGIDAWGSTIAKDPQYPDSKFIS